MYGRIVSEPKRKRLSGDKKESKNFLYLPASNVEVCLGYCKWGGKA